MKKTLSVLLAMILVIGVLAGCASSGGAAGANGTADSGDTASAAAPAAAADSFKVGFIMLHDENSTYDLNFINAAKAAAEELGMSEDQIILKTNVPEGQEC